MGKVGEMTFLYDGRVVPGTKPHSHDRCGCSVSLGYLEHVADIHGLASLAEDIGRGVQAAKPPLLRRFLGLPAKKVVSGERNDSRSSLDASASNL